MGEDGAAEYPHADQWVKTEQRRRSNGISPRRPIGKHVGVGVAELREELRGDLRGSKRILGGGGAYVGVEVAELREELRDDLPSRSTSRLRQRRL
eukprot:418343-Prorocentrum_minimum.AAC.1